MGLYDRDYMRHDEPASGDTRSDRVRPARGRHRLVMAGLLILLAGLLAALFF